MRVAFLYSGLLRNLKDLCSQHQRIIQDLSADVYGSFWETTDSEQAEDNLEFFHREFSPVLVEAENLAAWKKSFDLEAVKLQAPSVAHFSRDWQERQANLNSFCMWYKVWRANYLRHSAGREYDLVVRLRTDLNFTRGFVPVQNTYLNLPSGFVYIDPQTFGPHDYLAYGSSEVMDYYSSLFLHLQRYVKECEFVYQPENLLRVHLSQMEQTVRMWEDDIRIFRSDSGNVDTGSGYYLHNTSSWFR